MSTSSQTPAGQQPEPTPASRPLTVGEVAAALAAGHRLPHAPWAETPTPLTPERLAEYAEVIAQRDAEIVAWLGKKAREYASVPKRRQESVPDAIARLASKIARDAVRPDNMLGAVTSTEDAAVLELRAEVARLTAELAKYVGHEPTLTEEMQHLNSCLTAVYDLADAAKRRGHEVVTVAEVEQAADGDRPQEPKDNRRRIYIDGKGRAWIDQCIDENGVVHAVPIVDAAMEGRPLAQIREVTGGLREIGRCW